MKDNIIKPKGIYRDQLITAEGIRFDSGWCSNIIVNHCRDLLAAFMKGDGAMGIQHIAIGQGNVNWDSTPPGKPAAGTSVLEDVTPFEVNVSSPDLTLEYLNTSNEIVIEPTNRIQVTVNFDTGSPPIELGEETYPLREFGLFGRIGPDSYMIDYVRHPVIHKGPDDTLVRRIRLVF